VIMLQLSVELPPAAEPPCPGYGDCTRLDGPLRSRERPAVLSPVEQGNFESLKPGQVG